jgi:hypothetical protein
MSDWPSYRPQNSVIISPLSPESLSGQPVVTTTAAAPITSTWPSASLAIGYPFVVYNPIIITKLFVENGANVAGNWDVGIYGQGLSQITNMTAAMVGATAIQAFDITDVTLNPGIYYLFAAQNNIAASAGRIVPAINMCAVNGAISVAAGFPLPATITASRISQAFIPMVCALVGPRTAI